MCLASSRWNITLQQVLYSVKKVEADYITNLNVKIAIIFQTSNT